MALTFLVVEDEPNLSGVISLIIENSISDSRVYVARTNDEAYQLLDTITPNLITTDINRPGGDGVSFLSRLRREPKTEFVPVIAISGTAFGEQRLDLYDHGFDTVLPKPFLTEELISAITRLLRLHSDPDLQLVHLGVETQSLDYKETVDLSSKLGRASLAKDVMAMANWGGGNIVVGVAESRPGEFVPKGIPDLVLDSFETTRLNHAINEFIDPPVPISVRRKKEREQTYVILTIPAAVGSLVLVKRQHEAAAIYPGRIYSRTTAAESAEVKNSSELRDLLDRLNRRKN